jgi:small-conductance mechanosensitive channel
MGAILLLVAGWVAAYLLQLTTRKLVTGIDVLLSRRLLGRHGDSISTAKISMTSVNLIGRIVFWVVLVFFVTAAAKILGWELFSGWLQSLIRYLPNLITGILIIFIGFLISNAARTAIAGTAVSAGLARSDILAGTVQAVIIFTAVVIGIEQIGINVGFLTTIMAIVAGVLLAGGALAFALGAKTLVANIIGAQFARKYCRMGEVIHIGAHEGELLEITQTALILDIPGGRACIPAKIFHEQISISSYTGTQKSGK